MNKLNVSYLGLKLKNPVIVSSCGLTGSVESIVKMEKAGAGAVVIKSLFEEQIDIEVAAKNYFSSYPEANDYIAEYTRSNSIKHHLDLISGAKAKCSIPVIASISCVSGGEWVSFAKKLEEAGADAIELNIFLLPADINQKRDDIEKGYLDTVAAVCESVSIPVSVKIGHNFTNIPAMVREIYYRGAKGVVMFNRFYEPDIDIEKLEVTTSNIFSKPSDFRSVLRWLGISSAQVKEIDYAASTGIHSGENAIKALLAGASAVQVCSTVYENGECVIGEIISFIKSWMERHEFVNVSDITGKMNYGSLENPMAYERTQFMKYFSSFE